MVQESTWIERRPSFEERRALSRLLALQQMTDQWFSDADVSESETQHLLERVAAPEVRRVWDQLRTLRTELTQVSVESMEAVLQAEMPAELLQRFERTILVFQASGLGMLLEKTPKNEQSAMVNLLEQSSWRAGKLHAETEWKGAPIFLLRDVLSCLRDSPFGVFEGRPRVLVIRSTQHDMMLEVRSCPHTSLIPEVKQFAQSLCTLHARWVAGFIHGLMPQIRLNHVCPTGSGYCGEVWSGPASPFST